MNFNNAKSKSSGYKSSRLNPEPTRQLPVSPEFELRLMELAGLDPKVYEEYWNNHGQDWIISKHVLCYKIYEEIVDGRLDLILERGKKLVVKLKRGDKRSHARAVKVYRDILQVHRLKDEALEMLSIDSSQSLNVGQRKIPKESVKTSSQHKRKFRRMGSSHEDLDKVSSRSGHERRITLSDFPLSLDEIPSQRDMAKTGRHISNDSPKKGEPSSNSHSTKRSWPNESVKKEWQNTKDYVSIGESTYKDSNSKLPEIFNEEFDKVWPPTPEASTPSVGLTMSLDEGHVYRRQELENMLQFEPNQLPEEKKLNEQLDKMWGSLPDKGYSSCSNSGSIIQFNIEEETEDGTLTPLEWTEEKVMLDLNNLVKDLAIEESKEDLKTKTESSNSGKIGTQTLVLEKFPGENFKDPIKWNIDGKYYEAQNIADLRGRHNVLIAGAFKKSSRGHIWNNYYGFLLASGVMLCFRKETLKKVADFRKSNVTILNRKQFKLSVRGMLIVKGISVDLKETTWQMKFSSRENFSIWHESLARFTN